LGEDALLVTITAPPGEFVASTEWVLRTKAGGALLVYLPQLDDASGGVTFVVAQDGSSYWLRVENVLRHARSGPPLGKLARPALGQTLPIAGAWPFQQRIPVAHDAARASGVAFGELGVDPERGRFRLAPGDPAAGAGALGVDYAEGFTDRV